LVFFLACIPGFVSGLNFAARSLLGWCGGLAFRVWTSKRWCSALFVIIFVLIAGTGVVVFGWLLGRSAACLHVWIGVVGDLSSIFSLQQVHKSVIPSISFQAASLGVSFASLLSLPLPCSSSYSPGQVYHLQDQTTVLCTARLSSMYKYTKWFGFARRNETRGCIY